MRKKGYTARQSKRRSRQMENAFIGTHNVRSSHTRQNLRRGSVYGERRESGGTVRYAGNRIQRRERSKHTGFIVLCAIIVVAAAVVAGTFAFHAAVSSKFALNDSSVTAVLAKETEGEPMYALFVADLKSSDGNGGADAVLLARIDSKNRAISLLNIPYNLQVSLSDGEYHALYEAENYGGDAALITAVQNATGIQISHFMRTDQAGFKKIVDGMGGIEVVLTEDLDDPTAGTMYLSAGTYTLNGDQAVTYLLAENFSGGVDDRAHNICDFAATQAEALFAKAGMGFLFTLDDLGGNVKTDLDSHALVSLEDSFAGLQAEEILSGITPGYETSKGAKRFVADSTTFSSVLSLFTQGESPVVASSSTSTVDPSSFTILVKNGAGVTGEGKTVAGILTNKGFTVTDVQNADSTVYDETLIIYQDTAMIGAANAVKDALGFGRVISAGTFYVFDEDILVMCGGDRKVTAAG